MTDLSDTDGRTPLMAAAAGNDGTAVVALLAGGADPRVLDDHVGASALHFAAAAGAVGGARLLLDQGAPVNLQTVSNGVTPLMTAVWHRHPPMVKLLLGCPEINVHLRSAFGATAMDLIDADVVTGQDKARESDDRPEDVRRMAAMLNAHLDLLHSLQNDQHLIALLGSRDLKDNEIAERIRALLATGESVDQVAPNTCSGNDGHTPLLMAARDGRAEVVSVLLKAGADIRRIDTYMKAHAAHKAAYNGRDEVLRRLATHPDFPLIRDVHGPFNGYTALHDATWHGHLKSVCVLLEAGADPEAMAHDGRTPADLARAFGYLSLVSLLQTHTKEQQ